MRGKHDRHEGDHVLTQDPLLAREFPRHRIIRTWCTTGPGQRWDCRFWKVKRVTKARVSDGAVVVGAHDEVCTKMYQQVTEV